ncbi:MAG: efflux RND transporter permease subunit, partial [Pseudomonadota bacterium]
QKYIKLLGNALNHPKKFIFIISTAMIFIITSYSMFNQGTEFFPEIEPENALVNVYARGNLSVTEKDNIVKQVEDIIINNFSEEIRIVYGKSGRQGGGADSSQQAEDIIGSIFVEFADWRYRRKASILLEEIKLASNNLHGVIIRTEEAKAGPNQNKPIELQIASNFPDLIIPVARQIVGEMQQINGFNNIEDTVPIPAIEWNIKIDRATASRLGTDVLTVGNAISLVTNGIVASTYRPDDTDDEVDVLVRFPREFRHLGHLDNLRVMGDNGLVPISYFIERKAQQNVSSISRAEGYRIINISSDVKDGFVAQRLLMQLQERIKAMDIDPNVLVLYKGDNEEQAETGNFLMSAFLIALFAMALILVTQFNSVKKMLIILSAVFLSTNGVLLGLLITGQTFGVVMCGVGIIALSGIVVNNNIILIDTFEQYKKQKMELKQAILQACQERLRPILLTSVTTILGLIPMVFGMNINFITREITFGAPSTQWWNQLSTTIAGGLAFATILTLFLTPCLLLLVERKKYYNMLQ